MSGRSTKADEYGWNRGLGAYSKDDTSFGKPRHQDMDRLAVKNEEQVFSVSVPSGSGHEGGCFLMRVSQKA
jgi:hypothetical protein